MDKFAGSRRRFLKGAGLTAGALLLPSDRVLSETAATRRPDSPPGRQIDSGPADYTIRIEAAPIEAAPKVILSTITYNGQFPGPLIRFHEGRQATVDNLGLTLFHCHQQLHMDFGFMALFDYL